jgi:hypothetical protein
MAKCTLNTKMKYEYMHDTCVVRKFLLILNFRILETLFISLLNFWDVTERPTVFFTQTGWVSFGSPSGDALNLAFPIVAHQTEGVRQLFPPLPSRPKTQTRASVPHQRGTA